MYKLVIVEDEHDVRQRLIGLVEKAESKFKLCGEYENGIDAYDGILSECPDLIITDIKIPYIEGLELVEKVRQVLPLVKVIVITGFNEFDYAKQAANLGVVGFISKPVTMQDIKSLLFKTQDILDREYLTQQNLGQLQAFYESSLPIIRENELYRLSNLQGVSPAFEKRLAHSGIRLNYRFFAMCVFDFDEVLEDSGEPYDLAMSSVRKLAAETIGDVCDFDLFSRYEKLCLILKSNSGLSASALATHIERIILRVGRYSGMPLSAGLSNVYENNKNFAGMLKEALHALEIRRIMGGRKVFLYSASSQNTSLKPAASDATIRELGYLLRFKSSDECIAALAEIWETPQNFGDTNTYYYLLTSVLNALLQACDDLEGLLAARGGEGSLYSRLFEMKTADEAFEFFKDIINTISALNSQQIVNSMERNMQKVLAYMDAHYCDASISFETMAADVNFSVSYISAIFKKNMGTTFVKQLTSMRMEKAKQLLQNPSLKIIDVAEQVGYQDPYYFSHCFRKYTGMSPKEYRSNE